MMNVQTQFNKAMNTFSYYNTREYVYRNDNFQQLTVNMNKKDNEIFYCDFKKVKYFFLNFLMIINIYIISLMN